MKMTERIPIPFRASEYVRIYTPLPDIYNGVDTEHFRSGMRYEDWITNDFSIVRDKNEWHIVGITHPRLPGFIDAFNYADGDIHEAEYQLFHAKAHAKHFRELMRENSFSELPKILYPEDRTGERYEIWAPQIMKHDRFEIVYSPGSMHIAQTEDFKTFERRVLFDCDFSAARDPYTYEENGKFYCIYCDKCGISMRESDDLIYWSEPETISDGFNGTSCESPCLFKRGEYYYLLWSIYDGRNGAYDERTFVYAAKDVHELSKYAPITMIDAHAAEVVRDGDDYYLLSVFYPENGISAAKLEFK